MLNKLIKLGLQEKEARVYIALLELGGGGVTKLTEYAGINRTSAYDILARLIEKGIVTEVLESKKQSYSPEPPEKLVAILKRNLESAEEHMKIANEVLPDLRALFRNQSARPHVRIVEGISGLKSLYEDTLFSSETIRSFSSIKSLEGFDAEFLHGYYRRRAKKGVGIKAIIDDVPAAHEYKEEDLNLKREIRMVPKGMMDVKPEIYVYENKVAIFSLNEKLGVLIESHDIAHALKKLYDLAWDKAAEY